MYQAIPSDPAVKPDSPRGADTSLAREDREFNALQAAGASGADTAPVPGFRRRPGVEGIRLSCQAASNPVA